jgi:hypothetical protein
MSRNSEAKNVPVEGDLETALNAPVILDVAPEAPKDRTAPAMTGGRRRVKLVVEEIHPDPKRPDIVLRRGSYVAEKANV